VGIGILAGATVLGLGVLLGVSVPAIPVQASDPSLTFRLEADPVAIGATILFLLAVATGACLRPTLRALRVDPMAALKAE
jgi:ABC-type antimicrobial peptide transport system permease subunit